MNRMKMEVDGYTIHTVNPDDHLEDMVGDGQEEGEIIYEYLVRYLPNRYLCIRNLFIITCIVIPGR